MSTVHGVLTVHNVGVMGLTVYGVSTVHGVSTIHDISTIHGVDEFRVRS